ncbi:MAG: sigma-70 family RNA polymerase sigma factor [Clostridia bacterium]|nr:sigma-70 family RNA polymerase sigma factor [Clostridia bacterium]
MNDEEIISLYWARNERAIEETHVKYGHFCYSIANNILKNNEDSEECVNDTYYNVWNTVPPKRPNVFAAFLGRITRNLSLKRYRAKTAKKRAGGQEAELSECIPDGAHIDERLSAEELGKSIDSFLRKLPLHEQQIFVLRYWYNEKVADIAKRSGFGESKVKMVLSRTRKKLASHLAKEGYFI